MIAHSSTAKSAGYLSFSLLVVNTSNTLEKKWVTKGVNWLTRTKKVKNAERL